MRSPNETCFSFQRSAILCNFECFVLLQARKKSNTIPNIFSTHIVETSTNPKNRTFQNKKHPGHIYVGSWFVGSVSSFAYKFSKSTFHNEMQSARPEHNINKQSNFHNRSTRIVIYISAFDVSCNTIINITQNANTSDNLAYPTSNTSPNMTMPSRRTSNYTFYARVWHCWLVLSPFIQQCNQSN